MPRRGRQAARVRGGGQCPGPDHRGRDDGRPDRGRGRGEAADGDRAAREHPDAAGRRHRDAGQAPRGRALPPAHLPGRGDQVGRREREDGQRGWPDSGRRSSAPELPVSRRASRRGRPARSRPPPGRPPSRPTVGPPPPSGRRPCARPGPSVPPPGRAPCRCRPDPPPGRAGPSRSGPGRVGTRRIRSRRGPGRTPVAAGRGRSTGSRRTAPTARRRQIAAGGLAR